MTLDNRAAAVHLGDGFVARWPGAIVCVPPSDRARGVIEHLDRALAVGGTDPGPGRVLEAVGELIGDASGTFAAIVSVDVGLRGVVSGHAEIVLADRSIVGTPGDVTIEDLPESSGPVVLRGLGDGSSPTVDLFDLRSGIVPGRAVTLRRRDDAEQPSAAAPVVEVAPPPAPVAPMPEPEPELAVSADFEVLDLGADVDTDEMPLPVLAEGPAAPPIEDDPITMTDGAELVPGILCSRGHFNNPQARYCMVCGISMVHLTHRIVEQPRPTLGFAVFDDGATYAFDRSYVVGRDPDDEAAHRGAEALLLDDTERTVSRAHAEIRLVEWDVVLTDLGSTNGTFVWNPPAGRWDRLEPGTQRRLESGAAVSIGRRTFVFESVHRLAPVSGPSEVPGPPPELQ
ncbi:MAG: FHA domain-containing protein [Actinomycetota bacterium]